MSGLVLKLLHSSSLSFDGVTLLSFPDCLSKHWVVEKPFSVFPCVKLLSIEMALSVSEEPDLNVQVCDSSTDRSPRFGNDFKSPCSSELACSMEETKLKII